MYKMQFSNIDSVSKICMWQIDEELCKAKLLKTRLVRTTMLVDKEKIISTVEWVINLPDETIKTVPPSGAFANRNCRIISESTIPINCPFIISDLEMIRVEELTDAIPSIRFEVADNQDYQYAIFDGREIKLL